MANENQVDVQIKLGADINGGIQTEAELERLKKKSKDFGDGAVKSSKDAAAGMNGFAKSVGLVRKALMGFGVIGIFTSIISAVQKVAASFEESKKKAEEFRKAAEANELAKSISALADSYDKVKAAIDAAAEAEKNALEIIDMEVKARRDLQEAKIDAAEQDELEKVDANAPDAAEQKNAIAAKYAHMRATNAASNKIEDLVLQRQKYASAAKQNDREAAAASAQAEALRKKAQEVRGFASREAGEANSSNDKDRNGFWSALGGNIKDIVTLDWGHVGNTETAEGDAEREKHSAKADEYNKQAEAMDKDAEALEKQAKAKKDEAAQNRKRGEAMNGSVEAAQIAQGTTQVKESLAERDAASALKKKQDEEARKAKELADAQALLASGDVQAARYRSRITSNNQKITDTSYQVATGKISADAGSRAVTELQESNRALNELLQKLLHEMEQSKQEIKKANEQARNSRGVDSTEGA